MVKNLPANAGDTVSIPDPGRFAMLKATKPTCHKRAVPTCHNHRKAGAAMKTPTAKNKYSIFLLEKTIRSFYVI